MLLLAPYGRSAAIMTKTKNNYYYFIINYIQCKLKEEYQNGKFII